MQNESNIRLVQNSRGGLSRPGWDVLGDTDEQKDKEAQDVVEYSSEEPKIEPKFHPLLFNVLLFLFVGTLLVAMIVVAGWWLTHAQ